MPCIPSSISAVASNYVTLTNYVKKAKTGLYSDATDRYTLENLNRLIKNIIDERDEKNSEKEKKNGQSNSKSVFSMLLVSWKRVIINIIVKLTTIFDFLYIYGDSFNYVIFDTPKMLEVLNEARVIQADLIFPGAKFFPYVLIHNMVSFSYETLNHRVVARVLMTSLTVC